MADMGVTEVGAVIQETVSALVQKQLIETSKLVGTVTNYAARPGENTIKIPKAGNFTVNDKAENTAVTAQVLTYATDDLVLNKHKAIQMRLEDIAGLQSMVNVKADAIERMAKQMALQVDVDIAAQLVLASASSPDHRIAYVGSALAKADLLAARTLLHVQYVPFSECFIGVSPASESALLGIDDFVHADKYGSSGGLVNGELGRIYGARVIMSTVFADAGTVIWHPTAVAFGRQMDPKFETDRDVPNLADLMSLSTLYGVKVLDSGKRQVLLGSAT